MKEQAQTFYRKILTMSGNDEDGEGARIKAKRALNALEK